MNNLTKNLILWLVIAMVLMAVFNNFAPNKAAQSQRLDYSTFLNEVNEGRIERVTIQGKTIYAKTTSGQDFITIDPSDQGLIGDLLDKGVVIEVKEEEKPSFLAQIVINWFPLLLIIGVWIYLMRQMQGGGGRRGR